MMKRKIKSWTCTYNYPKNYALNVVEKELFVLKLTKLILGHQELDLILRKYKKKAPHFSVGMNF